MVSNISIAIGKILITQALGESAESERGFEKSSWRVSLVAIVVAAILGSVQEVICRQAADGVFSSTKHSSTHHHQPKQVQLNGAGRHNNHEGAPFVLLLLVKQCSTGSLSQTPIMDWIGFSFSKSVRCLLSLAGFQFDRFDLFPPHNNFEKQSPQSTGPRGIILSMMKYMVESFLVVPAY